MKLFYSYFLFIISISITFSQEVGNVYDLNCYKYVMINIPKYNYNKQDDKEIIRTVRNLFLNKGFKTYTNDVDFSKLPAEYYDDSCIVLNCFLEYNPTVKTTDFLRITLKNCIEEIVYENTGKSIWSMGGAIDEAFEPIKNMNYEYDPNRKITPIK
jgi:hypothetical protein